MLPKWMTPRYPSAGAAGRGRGRPREDGNDPLVSIRVTLPVAAVDAARRIGFGNVSLGLRKMLKHEY